MAEQPNDAQVSYFIQAAVRPARRSICIPRYAPWIGEQTADQTITTA